MPDTIDEKSKHLQTSIKIGEQFPEGGLINENQIRQDFIVKPWSVGHSIHC